MFNESYSEYDDNESFNKWFDKNNSCYIEKQINELSSEEDKNYFVETKETILSQKRNRDYSIDPYLFFENENKNENIVLDSSNKNQNFLFTLDHKNKKNKKGRKALNETEKGDHDKFKPDNIRRKIKTYFIKYVIAFLNSIIIDKNMSFIQLDPYISTNVYIDFNKQLLKATLKQIILKVDISKKYKTKYNNFINRDIIKKLYEDNKNEEIIKILNLTYGEVFDIFIREINEEFNNKKIDNELLDKIQGTSILDINKFKDAKLFLNEIRNKEMITNKNKEDVDKYINEVNKHCIEIKEWFNSQKARKRGKQMKIIKTKNIF